MLKALVYDFDGTLTPTTMPEFKILEKSGLVGGAENPEFLRWLIEWRTNEKSISTRPWHS